MLDSMILYNRPRRRDEVADFVAASGGDYTLLRLCGLRCAAAYLYLTVYRAHKHAHQLTRGRADARRSAGIQRAGTGAEDAEGARRARAEGEQAQGRGFTARRCARGLGGAYDIGRDGTSSGGRAQAHSCGRAQAGGRAPGVFGGDYAADYDARRG